MILLLLFLINSLNQILKSMKLSLKIYTLIFLMCFLFQNLYSQQNINGWYWMNGQPQTMYLEWIKFISPTDIYAVGDRGNFMKSSDGGDTWLINSQAGGFDNSSTTGGGTRDLKTAFFFNANTGLVGGQGLTGSGDAIGRTTDGGTTFSRIVLRTDSITSVTGFSFINSTTGYACGSSRTRLYKTTDAGITWTVNPNIPFYSYNAVYAFDENKIFAVSSNRTMVKTTNGGTSWSEMTLPGSTNNELTDIDFKNANTGFVTGNANYFAYTYDGGATWTQSVTPFGALGQRALAISGNDVYTAGDFTVIYKSTDNGITWSTINFIDASNPNQPSPFYMYGLDASGDNIAVVGTNGIINISNDGGATWRNKNYCVSTSASSFTAIWADTPKGKIWTAGTGGTVLFSSNGGSNWTQQPSSSTLPTNNIRMLNSSTGFAAVGATTLSSGGLIKTTNAGTNWVNISIPPFYAQKNVVDVDFINESTGWILGGMVPAGGGGLTCLKTTDGGITWTNQPNNQSYNDIALSIDMVDENTGYYTAGLTNFLFKTTNGGNNWNRVTSFPGTGTFNRVKTVSSDVVFVSGGSGQLYKSTNSGTSWTQIPVPIPTSTVFAMNWQDELNGLIGGTSGFLAKTTDGGATWDLKNSGGSTIRDVCIRNRDSVFAVSDLNGPWQVFRYYSPAPAPLSLLLKVGIQGFWNGTTQVSDTISVTLRSQNAPYNVIDQSSMVLYNQGSGTVGFSSAPAGNYYIQINHRNSLETWSSVPMAMGSNLNQYDYTTASSQAYGNNTTLTSGRYCNYSGDVNQEGNVDLSDIVTVNNSSSVFEIGYVVADVNGDDFVDLSDLVITSNNASNFVVKMTP